MQTIKLEIEDSKLSIVLNIIQNLKDGLISKYEIENSAVDEDYPLNVVVSSIEEVQKRVLKAEKSVSQGNFVEEEVFWSKIDQHMKHYED